MTLIFWLDIPYPWVENEAHHLNFDTNTGLSFEHTIEVKEKIYLLTYLSFSIGIHNLGEGLAIGTAFAVGKAALSSLDKDARCPIGSSFFY